jgi:hypothetical protein
LNGTEMEAVRNGLTRLMVIPFVLRSAVRDNIKNLQQLLDVLAPTDVKSSSYTLKEDLLKCNITF